MKIKRIVLVFCTSLSVMLTWSQSHLGTREGRIKFVSDAPLELISAQSNQCKGVVNLETNEFSFQVEMRSFEGFNSALQREHFCENYMEVDQYPDAKFKGRVLDSIDFEGSDDISVRVIGDLTVHGITDERIIEVSLSKKGKVVRFTSEFEVELDSHGIEIPRIVYQKIAETIYVEVQGEFSEL